MRKRSIAVLLFFGLVIAYTSAGCSSSSATPTVKPTETESIVFVVVTATLQPTLEATTILEPTITPLATFTPVGFTSPTPTNAVTASPTVRKATAVNTPAGNTPAASTPRPVSTAKATATNVPPTPAPLQYVYGAPAIIGPAAGTIINEGNAIELQFNSVGPLPADVCYIVNMQFINPNASPGNVPSQWCFSPGDQSSAGARLKMSVTRFATDPYNYLVPSQQAERLAVADYLTIAWSVYVGKQDGTRLSPISTGPALKFQPR